VDELDAGFLDPAFFEDPHPFYRRLREEDPVHWSDALQSWVLTRHADVVACLRDPRFSSVGRVAKLLDRISAADAREQLAPLYSHFSTGLIHSDPPAHTRIRGLINKAFTPRTVERMRPRLQRLVDDHLDAIAADGRMDVIADLAFPLPVTAISEVLGVPIEDRVQFKRWCDRVNTVLAGTHTLEDALEIQTNVLALREFLGCLIAERRRSPRDDLISRLIAAQTEGGRLSEMELMQTAVTLLIAAHETTTNLIGNAVLVLLRNRGELERLRREAALLVSAIEEFLRYESPLNHFTRIVKEDVRLDGCVLRAGDLVAFSLLAANRDPAQFPEPDVLDVARRDNRHLAFGFGPHFCLGAGLARLEGGIAIGTVLRRFPGLRLASDSIEWRRDRVLRAATAIPVVF
jgi:cytochrome P450